MDEDGRIACQLAYQTLVSGRCYSPYVTPPGLDTPYTVQAELNYSLDSVDRSFESANLTTAYEKDTSGDGLTDQEKEAGWEVVVQPCAAYAGATNGACDPATVRATVADYSTNGLASDPTLENAADAGPALRTPRPS